MLYPFRVTFKRFLDRFLGVLPGVSTTIRGASTPLVAYGFGLSFVVAALVGGLVFAGEGLGGPAWAVVLLGAVAAAAERQPVRIATSTEITVAFLPVLFAAVVYGPLAAIVVASLGLLVDLRPPYARWVIWTLLRALAGGLGGVAAQLTLAQGKSIGSLCGAVVLAAAIEASVDAVVGAGVVALRGSGSFWGHLKSVRPVLLATIPLYAPMTVLLVFAYEQISPWSVILFVGPAFAAHRFYRLYQEERDATRKLGDVNAQLERANLSFATALVATLDARDRYTAGHSAAVAIYARDIAARLGLAPEQQSLAHLAGLVHDIGKIGLAAGLLEKPGALTLDERRQMEDHSVIGERILRKVDDYAEIAAIVRHHHERVDGNGYPDRLEGDDIPLLARIIAVADAYNAMTSDRPYRDAMPSRVARLRLAQAVETQFDTTVVAAFEAILASASEDYRLGTHAAFALEADAAGVDTESSLLRPVAAVA